MPRGDRTGPEGEGEKTGRGAGFCSGSTVPGFENPDMNRGREGRGLGLGFARGGRGLGIRGLGIRRGRIPSSGQIRPFSSSDDWNKE